MYKTGIFYSVKIVGNVKGEKMKSFIDCHCHAFNLVDVPMYLTLEDKVKMGTFKRLALSLEG